MTEMVNGMSQGSDSGSQPVTSSAPQVSAPPASSGSEERSFRQSEVNEIVKRAKNDAVDTYRRMSVEQPQYTQQKYGEVSHTPSSVGQQGFNEDSYRRIAAEEAKRHLDQARQEALQSSQEEMAKRTVQNFYTKITPGREKYQDFDSVTGDVDLRVFPNVVQLLGDYVENSSDVLYELGKDRIKLESIESLANRSPQDAIKAVRKLSQSLKDNEAAGKVRHPNEPLSQVRPSNAGTETGTFSVSDARRKYRV